MYKFFLALGLVLLDLDIAWLSHLVLTLILLYHSAVSSMPSGVLMSCCRKHFISSLNGYCRAYAMHHEGTWYSLLSGLTCNKKIPSKYQIPLNTSLNSLYSHCVILSLAFLSASIFGPAMKYFMLLLLLSLTIGLCSISNCEPSVFVYCFSLASISGFMCVWQFCGPSASFGSLCCN